jgi:hypothetical protein
MAPTPATLNRMADHILAAIEAAGAEEFTGERERRKIAVMKALMATVEKLSLLAAQTPAPLGTKPRAPAGEPMLLFPDEIASAGNRLEAGLVRPLPLAVKRTLGSRLLAVAKVAAGAGFVLLNLYTGVQGLISA